MCVGMEGEAVAMMRAEDGISDVLDPMAAAKAS